MPKFVRFVVLEVIALAFIAGVLVLMIACKRDTSRAEEAPAPKPVPKADPQPLPVQPAMGVSISEDVANSNIVTVSVKFDASEDKAQAAKISDSKKTDLAQETQAAVLADALDKLSLSFRLIKLGVLKIDKQAQDEINKIQSQVDRIKAATPISVSLTPIPSPSPSVKVGP